MIGSFQRRQGGHWRWCEIGDGGVPVGVAISVARHFLQTKQHDSDVVLAARCVGGRDQRLAAVAQRLVSEQHVKQLHLAQHRGEPVAADQIHILCATPEGAHVNLDRCLGTQRPGDHRALGVLLGFPQG